MPPLTSRRVLLEPLRQRHIPALHEIASGNEMIDRWPLEGRKMEQDDFEALLWRRSQLQYAVIRRDSSRTVGLVQAVKEHPRSRTTGLSFFMEATTWHRGWPLEAVVLFLNLLFDAKGFRKVYLHMTQSTLERVGTAVGSWLTCEATLTQHARSGLACQNLYEDLHIFSLRSEQWDQAVLELVGAEGIRKPSAYVGAR